MNKDETPFSSDIQKTVLKSDKILIPDRFEDPPEVKFKRPKLSWQNPSQTHYQSVGMGLSLSYSLILSPLSGMAIGWLLEQKYNVSTAMVWGLFVGIILGFTLILLTLSKNR